MELSFSATYKSGADKFSYLDGYDGSVSLMGVSQILMISLNAFLNRDVIGRAPSARGFRLVLGASRRGSWQQLLHLLITDQHLRSVAEDLGRDALYDLLKWTFLGGVGVIFLSKHKKTLAIIEELQKKNDDLQEVLVESFKRAHYPVRTQGLAIDIDADNLNIVQFNQDTLDYLDVEIDDNTIVPIDVCISRFNARTGTGRLIGSPDAASIPFYPGGKITDRRRALLADNLALVARGVFAPITVYVSRVTSGDGRLKRYLIHGAEERQDPRLQ